MKKFKKFISLMLAFCMLATTTTTALAAENTSTPAETSERISYAELPSAFL